MPPIRRMLLLAAGAVCCLALAPLWCLLHHPRLTALGVVLVSWGCLFSEGMILSPRSWMPIALTLQAAAIVCNTAFRRSTKGSLVAVSFAIVVGACVSLPLPSAGNTSSQHEAVDGTDVLHLVVVVVAGTLIMTASFCFVPSSPEQLDVAEQRLLNFCSTKLRRCKIGPLHCIETVSETLYQRTDDKPTLVLLAGYGMGAATWYNVIDALASRFHVICVDRIGDGQSDRFSLLSNSIEETESLFVEALEQWREARGLARFILLGHSFGGYIAALYTLKYGHRVSQLVLASPLGVPARDAGSAARWEARIGKIGFSVLRFGWETVGVNAQALLRGLGPLGPMATWRGYILRRFKGKISNDEMLALADYWFQCNAARPGVYGSSFMSLLYFGASARLPLLERLDGLSKTMPMSLLYGGRGDWMGPDGGRQLAKRLNSLRSSSPDKYNGSGPQIDVHLVPDAGHQLFLENPTESAATLLRVIEMTY